MSTKKIIVISIILMTLFNVIYTIENVSGLYDDYIDIGYDYFDEWNENTESPLQNHVITHSSNQLVFASVDYTVGATLRIQVVDDGGLLRLNRTYDYYDEYYSGVFGIRVSELDDDYVIVSYLTAYIGAYDGLKANIIKINMNNYQCSEYNSAYGLYQSGSADHFNSGKSSSCFYEDENNLWFYIIGNQWDISNPDRKYWCVIHYDDSANTITIESSGYSNTGEDIEYQSPILIDLGGTIFGVYTFIDDGTPTFYTYDTATTTRTLCCTHGVSSLMNWNIYFNEIGKGVESFTTNNETHYIVYAVYSSNENLGFSTTSLQTFYLRMEYNNSIAPTNLLQSECNNFFYSTYNNGFSSYPIWSIGTLDNDLETIDIYYPRFDGIGNYTLGKLILSIDDFYDLDEYLLNIVSDDYDYDTQIYVNYYSANVVREQASEYQVISYTLATDSVWVLYGLDYFSDYFTMTTSYTPLDTPLIRNEDYTFNYVVKNNYINYDGAVVFFYVDDLLLSTKITNENGLVSFDVSFSTVGLYNITTKVYKNGLIPTLELTRTTSYLVIDYDDEDEPTQEENIVIFGDDMMDIAIDIIPIAICVLYPAYSLGKVGGFVGFLGGFVVGCVIAINASLIPIQYAYLLALIVVMGVVYAIKSIGGSRQ